MAKTTKAPALAAGTDPADMEKPADAGDTLPVEDTGNKSDDDIDSGEPVATTDRNEDPAETNDQMKSPQNEDGTRSYETSDEDDGDDDDTDTAAVSTGAGVVVGDGETIQTFVGATGDQTTGQTKDGATYATLDPASVGTTPLPPKPSTADALVAGIASPAKVEAHCQKVFDGLRSENDKKMAHGVNIFDSTGFNRSDLPALGNALNEHFGLSITIGEVQNFMVWQDVTNLVKRKLAGREAVSASE